MINSDRYQKRLATSIKNVISNYFVPKKKKGNHFRNHKDDSCERELMIQLTQFPSNKKEDSPIIKETICGIDLYASQEIKSSIFSESDFSNSTITVSLQNTSRNNVLKTNVSIISNTGNEVLLSKSSSFLKIDTTAYTKLHLEEEKKNCKVFPKEKYHRSIKSEIQLYNSRIDATKIDNVNEKNPCGHLINRKVPFIKEVILKPGHECNAERLVRKGENYRTAKTNEQELTKSSAEKSFIFYEGEALKLPKLASTIREKVAYFEKKIQEQNRFSCKRIQQKFVVNLYESRCSEQSLQLENSTRSLILLPSDVILNQNELRLNSTENDRSISMSTFLAADFISIHQSTSESSLSSNYEILEDEQVKDIIKEFYKQQVIIKQVLKIKNVYENTKNFEDDEFIAITSRISLLADLQKGILLKMWKTIEENYSEIEPTSTATITISNLELPLRTLKNEDNQSKMVYIITLSSDTRLYVSEILEIDPEDKSLFLLNSIMFNELRKNFVIDLNIYQLKILTTKQKNPTRNSCYSILKRNSKKNRKSFPSFTLCGSLRLTRGNLRNEIFLLDKITNDSTLCGTAKLNSTITGLVINKDYSSFLSVGTEIMGRITWDRKWCRLENTILNFWDNPNDELFNTPRIAINLEHCQSDRIEVAGKNLCTRSRTLILIGTNFNVSNVNNETLNETQYFLTADSVQEMEIWKSKLNAVLDAIRFWK